MLVAGSFSEEAGWLFGKSGGAFRLNSSKECATPKWATNGWPGLGAVVVVVFVGMTSVLKLEGSRAYVFGKGFGLGVRS